MNLLNNNNNYEKFDINQLFESTPVGFYRTTPEGKIVSCNPGFAKLFGYASIEEMKKLPAKELYYNPDKRKNILKMKDRDGFYIALQEKMKKKDGTPFWVEMNSRAYYDEDGKVTHYEGSMIDITKTKELELELKKERDTLQKYLNTAEALVLVINKVEKIVMVNEQVTEFLGIPKEELVGQNWIEIAGKDEESKKRIRKEFQELLEGKVEPYAYTESENIDKEGNKKYFIWRNNIIKNEKGENVATISFGVDITKTKTMEIELKKSEALYKAIFEGSGSAMIMGEERKKISLCNKTFEKLTGYKREEIEKKMEFKDFMRKDDYTEMLQRVEDNRYKLDGKMEIPLKTKTGEIKQVLASRTEIPNTNLVVGAFVDLTERKKMEQELRDNEKFLQSIHDNAPFGLLVENKKGKLIRSNPAIFKMLGYSFKEMKEIDFQSITAPEDRVLSKRMFNRIVKEGEPIAEYEKRYIKKDGSLVPVRIIAWRVNDENDDLLYYMGFVEDITEAKKMEEIKKQSYEQIERNIEQFAFLADQVRNPLTIISGLAEMSEEESSSEIITQVDRIVELLNIVEESEKESRNVRDYLKKHL